MTALEQWIKDNEGAGWDPGNDEWDKGKGDYNQHFEVLSAPAELILSLDDPPGRSVPLSEAEDRVVRSFLGREQPRDPNGQFASGGGSDYPKDDSGNHVVPGNTPGPNGDAMPTFRAVVGQLDATAAEQAQIARYQSSSSGLNNALRAGGKLGPSALKQDQALQSVMAKNSLQQDAVLWRGLPAGTAASAHDPAYLSTSTRADIAAGHANTWVGESGGSLIRYSLPAGTPIAAGAAAMEVILNKGSSFRQTGSGSVTLAGVSHPVVYMEPLVK